MRGKLTFIGYDETATGITPADAGKTDTYVLCGTIFQDHPRGCGENLIPIHMNQPAEGITPAGAGKTQKRCFVFG